MSSPLRMRLTLWYVGAFSVVLILFSADVYFFVERILRERVDTNLRFSLQMTSSALARHTSRVPQITRRVPHTWRSLRCVGFAATGMYRDHKQTLPSGVTLSG